MVRRNFIKVGLSLAAISLLSGCMNTIGFKEIEPLNAGKISLDKYYKELSLLDMIKISYLKGVKRVESAGFAFSEESSYNNEVVYSLPWYLGPDITLSRDEYLLNIYNSGNLLFVKHGIRAKSYFLTKDSLIENHMNNLRELGYNNFNDLYEFIFRKIATYSKDELFVYINNLRARGLINKDIYSSTFFEAKNETFINKLYAPYISHEISLTVNELNNRDPRKEGYPLNNWRVNAINDISFKREDFYIYTFTSIICEEILNNYKKGLYIND